MSATQFLDRGPTRGTIIVYFNYRNQKCVCAAHLWIRITIHIHMAISNWTEPRMKTNYKFFWKQKGNWKKKWRQKFIPEWIKTTFITILFSTNGMSDSDRSSTDWVNWAKLCRFSKSPSRFYSIVSIVIVFNIKYSVFSDLWKGFE